jgi:hypothetical protein
VRRLSALVVLLGLALLGSAGTAAAHNVLVGSSPADGARVATGPSQVTLTFDLPVQAGFTTVTVTGPDGNQWQAGPAADNGTEVSAPVRPLGPAGVYTVGYQVLSADSHPVRGAVKFTLTAPGTGTPAGPSPNSGGGGAGAAQPPADAESGSTPVWPWVAGAGVLLVAGVVVALRVSRSG